MCSVHIYSGMSRLITVAGRNRLCAWIWILAFTPGVANLNMTVRQVIQAWLASWPWIERSLAVRLVTDVWSNCYGLVILDLYAPEHGVWWRQREVMRCV